MAGPNCAMKAKFSVEKEMKQIMVKTCEAEKRTKFLVMLLRLGLETRDVESKVVMQKRSLSRRGAAKLCKSSQAEMKKKINDIRKDEDIDRRERDETRK